MNTIQQNYQMILKEIQNLEQKGITTEQEQNIIDSISQIVDLKFNQIAKFDGPKATQLCINQTCIDTDKLDILNGLKSVRISSDCGGVLNHWGCTGTNNITLVPESDTTSASYFKLVS